VPRNAIGLAALAPRIADAAGDGWRDVRSAAQPSEAALLALARDMCHYPDSGR
jgi:uroporphyrinogen-III synthase